MLSGGHGNELDTFRYSVFGHRAWTDSLMKSEAALVTLAGALTGQSLSAGIGGFGSLGDRVAMSSTMTLVREDTDILDVAAFHVGLERILDEGMLKPAAFAMVKTFLDARDSACRTDDR